MSWAREGSAQVAGSYPKNKGWHHVGYPGTKHTGVLDFVLVISSWFFGDSADGRGRQRGGGVPGEGG